MGVLGALVFTPEQLEREQRVGNEYFGDDLGHVLHAEIRSHVAPTNPLFEDLLDELGEKGSTTRYHRDET